MLSRESLIDLIPLKAEIPLDRLYVTYNRIQQIEPGDDDSGPELLISGLSILTPLRLALSLTKLMCVPISHVGSIRPYMAYPYGTIQRP
jgi:hypothetical protein